MANSDHNNRLEELKKFDETKIGVKGLSDSRITSIPKIFIHPQKILTNLNNQNPSLKSSTIPVIDLSNNHRLEIIAQVKEAASKWGFFQILNHGISQSILDSTLKAIKSFHELPPEIKAKYYKREQEIGGVMYASNNDLYRAEAASWLDSLSIWTGHPAPVTADEIPEICRKEVIEWDICAKKVAESVLELLSEGLGLEKGKFKELSFSEGRALVGHCYPYCPQPELTVGITAHSDPGVLTVLLQDHIGGLQVKHGDGWVDVHPLHGALIINVGDFLQIVSNGEYRSVQHQVVANSCKEARTSIVEFFNLSKWKGNGYFGPLPELLSPEKPAIYRDFTKEEFIQNFYNKGLDSRSMVEKVQIPNSKNNVLQL